MAETAQTGERRRGTALIVDDDPQTLRFSAYAVHSAGFEVLTAASGAEAIAIAEQRAEPIDILVCDVLIPDLNGYRVAGEVCKLWPGIEVLFVSGYSREVSDPEHVLHSDINYLEKPFHADELAERITRILSNRTAPKRILVVDDDQAILRLLKTILVNAGYCTMTALNGKEAVDIARRTPVDLVITDLIMPEQEGMETIMELKRSRPELPVVAMSGATQFLPVARRLGACAVLTKPIDPEVLLAHVRHICNAA